MFSFPFKAVRRLGKEERAYVSPYGKSKEEATGHDVDPR
jgi:hypothetical protein